MKSLSYKNEKKLFIALEFLYIFMQARSKYSPEIKDVEKSLKSKCLNWTYKKNKTWTFNMKLRVICLYKTHITSLKLNYNDFF